MTPVQQVVSLAADEADERTDDSRETSSGEKVGPGIWHQHFIDVLHEQGWQIIRR